MPEPTDEVTWLRDVEGAMTPGPVRVNDSDEPNYWLQQIQGQWVVADFAGDCVHDAEANAIGFGALRNLAPSMLAVIEAATALVDTQAGSVSEDDQRGLLREMLALFRSAVTEEMSR